MDFKLQTPQNITRTFTTNEMAEIFKTKPEIINSTKYFIGISTKNIKVNGTRKSIYTYSDYMKFKAYFELRQNKDLNYEQRKKELKTIFSKIEQDNNEHPLVKDKRCLDINYWPDVVPVCFKE